MGATKPPPPRPLPRLPPQPPPDAVQPVKLEEVGEQFLQELARDGRYGEAAALAPRVLRVGAPLRPDVAFC